MKRWLCFLTLIAFCSVPFLNFGQNCNNWLKVNQEISGVQIGNLAVTGNQITVEALINRTTPYPDLYDGGDVVSKHDNPGDDNYLLRPTVAQITTTDGFFQTQRACAIELNKTYHIALVYDGETLKFYRNGFLMSQVNASGNLIQNNWLTKIGTTANMDSPYPADFIGYINEVRIWNVARSQNEIRQYLNQSLPNPASQTGLLAYYTFGDLKNKQGNAAWNGTILGDAVINQTNPTCSSFIVDSCAINPTNVTASFTGPDTACINTSVQFNNTSVGASNYYWSFCAAGFNTTPSADNLGNPDNTLQTPVFMDYALDDNGNYYGFISNYSNGHIVRLDYGNSLLNAPTATDLGNFGDVIPIYAEGIQAEKVNGKCYVFVVAAGDGAGAGSVLIRINFGSSFSNTSPSATSLGNVGDLLFPHDLFITAENDNYYGFTININNNTITRFDFGNDLENQPVGVNLGSVGNLDYPCGFSFVNTNGSWYAFVTNRNSNSISRLDFGNSLANTPTGNNIGNPGNFLNLPRDISIFQSCDGVVGLVVNEEDEETGTITKLNFGTDVLSNPTASDLDNLGDLKFPHSISKFFLQGNDIYSFITNVKNNTVTRLRYTGCTSSSISSSTQQTPPPVMYADPGIYNVNLLVDIGLPTQTSFCKQIVIKDCKNPCDSFQVNAGNDTSICKGSSVQLNAASAITYNWNASPALSDTTIANPVATPVNTTEFIVTGYNDQGCSDKDTVKITVLSLPVITLTNDTAVCTEGSIMLEANAAGNNIYSWSPAVGLSNPNIFNPVATPADTTKYYVTVTDNNSCISVDSVIVNVLNVPVVSTINDTTICKGKTIILQTTASYANIFNWSPEEGLSSSEIQNPKAFPSATTLYKISASNGICSKEDSVLVTVLSLPLITASNDTTVCGNASVQLNVSGGIFYKWNPVAGLSNPGISNPVASPASTTIYYVTGTGNNSCTNTDSVTITVQPVPVFTLSPQNASVCFKDSVMLTASGGDIYNWSPAQTVLDPSSHTAKVFPSVNTTYKVIITNSICKITDSLTADVAVKDLPAVTISKSNDIDCINFQAQLMASGGISYKWSPTTYINNTQINNPIVNPPADTWYSVIVKGTNSCSNKDSILVKSVFNPDAVSFEIASAFTPNHDGLNDCFSVKYWGPADLFDMSIYNRWGQLVYHSNNVNSCWDGTFKGQPQTTGAYVYRISVSSKCSGGLIHKNGTLVLIR